MSDSDDILQRLKHPEREQERHRHDKRLFYRNIINGTFILLAAVAMIGLGVSWTGSTSPTWCYGVALLAVFVKMFDVVLRIPDMLKRPKKLQLNNRQGMPLHTGTNPAAAQPDANAQPTGEDNDAKQRKGANAQ